MQFMKHIQNITIETLVLVAIWEKPLVFQGVFLITNQANDSQQILFFRVESELPNKSAVVEVDFAPSHYQFTHLFNDHCHINLKNLDDKLILALYLLRYALNITLKTMIHHPSQYSTYIDEIAMSQLSHTIEDYFTNDRKSILQHQEIGFAVSVDFMPTEMIGRTAAMSLLEIECFCDESPLRTN